METCTVLTTAANALMAPIHDRMPVIIDVVDYAAWVSSATDANRARALLQPWAASTMVTHRVSLRVNAQGHDDAGCVAPHDP